MAVAICGFGLAGGLFWLFGPLAFFAVIPFATFLILRGGFLIVVGTQDAWTSRSRPLVAASLVIAPIIVTALGAASTLPLIRIGAATSTWVWFLAHRGTYREIARQIESGELVPAPTFYQKALGTQFIVDLGPPKRVAFPLFGGFGDNWRAVVHDPTGVVKRARFRNPGEGGPDDIEMMFGGQMVGCRLMVEDFYDCNFT
ncbi:hypothetical protein [Mesorhizobium sp. 1M-11]|uniref:hypothetical protein n=1 Tax=Mesorhizobium sp. 1M-11 TaxID=1529006 RepID=UPI0006C75F99|nr:hypothetical protein [Mesorhizobium sp. 1M-11]